ncbi:TraB/GumN family protein [Erythrobacter sp. NE805]|uniref:TraB/GumN family protein n=1 Tax=Erythrobacter sp. NE805 TaxID=3389875 RepID=UPI00396AFE3A
MRWVAALLAPLLLLMLAGCSDAPGGGGPGEPANPLLYEIAAADGTPKGWLLGTIHALPPGTGWRTPEVGRVLGAADLLVVEVEGLADEAALARTFAGLAASPGLPPLAARVPPDLAAPLAALMDRGGFAPDRFDGTETWAAALALARVDAAGDPAEGVDRALIADFAGRPVRELEGAAGQLAIFDRLPEPQQRAMLAAVVREGTDPARDPERLQRAWIAGDAAAIAASTREGILADPSLREALLTARNRRWAEAVAALLAEGKRPLVAVGAAHLVGPEGLAALLQAKGYRLRRLT